MTLLSHPQVAAALDTFAAKTGIQRLSSKDAEALLTAILTALQAGEGLNHDAIYRDAYGNQGKDLDLSITHPGLAAAYDRQHRAIVGALRLRAEQAEGKIAEFISNECPPNGEAPYHVRLEMEIATLRAKLEKAQDGVR